MSPTLPIMKPVQTNTPPATFNNKNPTQTSQPQGTPIVIGKNIPPATTGGANPPTGSNPPTTSTTAPVLPTAAAPLQSGVGNDPTAPSDSAAMQALRTLTQTPAQLATSEQNAVDEAAKDPSASDVISKIEESFNGAISEAAGNANASANAFGQAGSPLAAEAESNATLPIIQQQEAAVATEMENIRSQAATDWQNSQTQGTADAEETLSQRQASQQNLQASFKNIAQNAANMGMNLSDFIQKNPSEAAYIQHAAYDGDYNAMASAFAMAVPPESVLQSWSNGSTYNQITRNPQTNKVSVQSFDLGVNVPTGWTSQKISTTTMMMQDPNNPANSVVYTTDPITGNVNISGTGTGSQIASQYNASSAGAAPDSSSTAGPASGPAATNYITTATSTAGIADPTSLFSTAINGDGTGTNTGVGIGPLVAGVLKAEGGSLPGVSNNPGNVKYVSGMANATDSGVKATDGGTFASFNTPESGEAAAGKTLTDIAASIGPNATVQDVLNKYANLAPASSTSGTTGPSGLSTGEYGLAANVPGFDPTKPGIDADAWQYLNTYLTQGKIPSATDVGLSSRSGSIAAFTTVKQRADDVYFKATGQHLPDQTILTANKKLVTGNNALLNSLKVQEGTIKANSDLLQGNITAENINNNAPIINNVLNGITNALGDPDTASYLAQNSTLSNELGSLLALKNASGTTVHDKLESAGLISPDATAQQEAAVVNTLMKEAQNAHAAIGAASADIYSQIDPLGLDPQNPINAPGYSEMNSAGATNNYNGTWSLNGQTVTVNSDGTVTPQ